MRQFRVISASGFSSIELLVALGLFFLLFSLSIPTLAKLGRRQALLQQSRTLSQDLQQLVLDSAYRSRELELQIRTSGYSAIEKEGDLALYAKDFKRGISAKLGSSGIKRVTFFPTQVVSPTRITLVQDTEQCQITLALRGRVRLEC